MLTIKTMLSWLGVVVLGLFNGILEDLLFVYVLVPYMPPSWDLTGDLFWVFTVPLAQLMALAITAIPAWIFLRLQRPSRLMVFWFFWSAARTAFLLLAKNPWGDVLIYLLWIVFWCVLIGLFARISARADPALGG